MSNPEYLVIASVQNEGPFLLEWVAHWQCIGADALLVYSHECSDGTDLLLDRLAAFGAVVHERCETRKRGPQRSALRHASSHPLYARANWAIAARSSEFPAIRSGKGCLSDLTTKHPNMDSIRMPTRLFSHNGHIAMQDDLCIAMFTEAEAKPQRGPRRSRALFRPASDPFRIGPHGPVYPDNRSPRIVTLEPTMAQMNHYAIRSIDGLAVSRNASKDDGSLRLKDWQQRLNHTIRDRSILRHLDAIVARVAAFREDPILRHLHDACFEWHAERAALLRVQPDYRTIAKALCDAPPVRAPAHKSNSPKRHANRRRMLATLPKGARCAEIGVWNGDFSAQILEVTEPEELVLIDPWDLITDTSAKDQTHRRHQDRAFMAQMREAVAKRYAGLPNVTIRKGFSQDVLASYPDNYFDWVYIDGNHLYEFVKRDVDMSFRKVRTGGVIAGDDFTWEKDGRAHVRDGVMDALAARGRKEAPRTMGQQYLITVDK